MDRLLTVSLSHEEGEITRSGPHERSFSQQGPSVLRSFWCFPVLAHKHTSQALEFHWWPICPLETICTTTLTQFSTLMCLTSRALTRLSIWRYKICTTTTPIIEDHWPCSQMRPRIFPQIRILIPNGRTLWLKWCEVIVTGITSAILTACMASTKKRGPTTGLLIQVILKRIISWHDSLTDQQAGVF